ncbi:MAG: ferrous iron transport protein B [Chloroflexi bacterium]|nr:ferrous iron transport protein B [Chloroflexota bacterium]
MSVQGLALQSKNDFTIFYGREAEEEIQRLQMQIEKIPSVRSMFPSRWLAIELLEKDREVREKLQVLEGGKKLLDEADKSITRLEELYGDDADVIIADHRYGWIHGLVRESVKQRVTDRLTTTDNVDKIVTNRWLGIPIFLAAMWAVFKLTVDVSAPYLEWVDGAINGPITSWVTALLGSVNLGGTWVESLLIDGVIAGVGGVLVFVPVLMFLYLALAILEDSGYMARAAFVMDRLMHAIGLHGKSFLPMLVGFGCTVPALYATRTLENEKDRILTGLLVPFMSCAARLPVYVLFAAIFFPSHAGAVVFAMYMIGIITAIMLGILLKKTIFKSKEQSTFVMELPPYRVPTLRSIWFHMWEHTGSFIRKAWTVILATSVFLWVLMAIPVGGEGNFTDTNVDSSLFATVSGVIAPVFKPLGFGTWEATGSLMTGFVAKEVVISSMAQIYGAEAEEQEAVPTTFLEDVGQIIKSFIDATVDTIKSLFSIIGINLFEDQAEEEPSALMESIRGSFEVSSGGHGALAGLAFIVFVLIYTPCMVAIAAERQELGAKWMWVSIIGQLALAWLLAFVVFQSGKLLGLG